jgi:DNA-binding MarR family transcriptional regulator
MKEKTEKNVYRLQDDGSLAWLFFNTVRRLQKFGKPGYSQQRILNILDEEGPISQKKLQEMLAVQAGSLSEICGKLEEKGMIERSRDEKDRRNVILKITGDGRKMKQAIHERKDNVIFSALNEQEREQLRFLLKKLQAEEFALESADYTEDFGKEAAG